MSGLASLMATRAVVIIIAMAVKTLMTITSVAAEVWHLPFGVDAWRTVAACDGGGVDFCVIKV